MQSTPHRKRPGAKSLRFQVAGAFALALCLAAGAQEVQHLSIAQPGGMPGLPVVTGIERASNGLKVTWDGPSGYYQLQQKGSLTNSKWQAVGKATNLVRNATLALTAGDAFFRVSGPAPQYNGAQACATCHGGIANTLVRTPHAAAFTNALFASKGGQTNEYCLKCHTVGQGLPTGFVSGTKTPHLGGVQCENCHGPAANHAANPANVSALPRVELAATVCGGCHDDPRHPTFDEWQISAHAQVVEGLNATNQINSCGRCHSGSVRSCLILGQALPTGDANVGIVCATCHDPHQTNSQPFQLRYPIASTNDYFMSANGTFASQYNPKINVCAQCHNDLGASWTNSAAAPHNSAQYNMMLGTVGELDPGMKNYQPAAHALLITSQCVGCHMQTAPYQSAALPAITGHSFKVDRYDVCLKCHPEPEGLVEFTQGGVSNWVANLKFDLDYWATNTAPASTNAALAALARQYGSNTWEYTAAGPLSPGAHGPTSAQQLLIPENIRKARFNLYMVVADGSYGVHNPMYIVMLLNTADEWVYDQIYQ